jgi:hypothetical protein
VDAPAAAHGADLQTKPNLSGRFASGLLLLPPADGERPGLLDRVEVLIELKVGLPPLGAASEVLVMSNQALVQLAGDHRDAVLC